MVDLTLRAYLGHDGYDFPGASGSGGFAHYIHHVKFNCNYGGANAPLDWFFGSFDNGAKEWEYM